MVTTEAWTTLFTECNGQHCDEEFMKENDSNVTLLNNSTESDNPPGFTDLDFLKAIVLSIMALVSFIGNIATLISFRKGKSTVNTLIIHLAVSDLFVTAFCMITDAVWAVTIQWFAGREFCKFIKYSQMFSLYLSTFLLVVISLDRYWAIKFPMSRTSAPKRVRYMIIVTWILSALFSTPQAIVFEVKQGPFKVKFLQCVTHGFYHEKWHEQLYTTLTLVFMFILPLLIIIFIYSSIFCTIARKSKTVKENSATGWRDAWHIYQEIKRVFIPLTRRETRRTAKEHDSNTNDMLQGQVRSKLLRKAKVTSLKMTIVIVAAFIVCWTPYYVVMIGHIFDIVIDIKASDGIFFFGMANSLVNPLIYGAFHICKKRNRTNWRRDNKSIITSSARTSIKLRKCEMKTPNNLSEKTHIVIVENDVVNSESIKDITPESDKKRDCIVLYQYSV